VVVTGAVMALAAGAGLFVLTRPGQLRSSGVVAGTTTSSTAVSPPTTTATTSASTTTTMPGATLGLRAGATGADVTRLQQRLLDLGFWLGSPDGSFSTVTTHAVVAFQKLAGLTPDGVVGATTQAALDAAIPPRPRSTEGHLLEIDLAHQVLIVADAGRAVAVIDVSTGRVAGTTPVGHFTITRQIDGYHRAPLGVLYRPKYFYEGVAIHGYPSVPPSPASHGCVRTINAAMDWLWASGNAPVGTAVWAYR